MSTGEALRGGDRLGFIKIRRDGHPVSRVRGQVETMKTQVAELMQMLANKKP